MSLPTTRIEIQRETALLLMEKAAARKLSLDEYLRAMAENDQLARPKTLEEILAPFRAEVQARGYSEDELEELFTEARKRSFKQNSGKSRDDD